MKILISIRSTEEVQDAIEGGAEILDLKEPAEGSLGAAKPCNINLVKKLAPEKIISVAIGDMPNLPGTAALAALGAASCNVDFIKVGLYGVSTEKEAINLLKAVVRATKDYNSAIKVVGAGYAEANIFRGLNPLKVPEIVKIAGADVAMLDTITKGGKSLFDYLEFDDLKRFVNDAHKLGLTAALAGSLSANDLETLYELGTDIVGFRGSVCTNNKRIEGVISAEKVKNIMKITKNLNYQLKREK